MTSVREIQGTIMFAEQKKEVEIAKREAQIKEWNAEIEKRQAQLQKARANAEQESLAELEKRLNQLSASRDAAKTELEKLKDATEETWVALLKEADNVFTSATQRFHEFVTKQS